MARLVSASRFKVYDFGKALKFNGSTNYASCPDSIPLDITGDIAISVRLKPLPVGAYSEAVFKGDNGAGNFSRCYGIGMTDTNFFRGILYVGGTEFALVSSIVLNPANYYHVVLTRTGTTANLYIDNVLAATATVSGSLNNTATVFALGRLGGTSSEYYTGLIDEVQVYNTGFTATDVQNQFYRSVMNPYPSNLKLYWKCDEGSGTSLTDSSGNGNTGTITGATYSSDVVCMARTTVTDRMATGINLGKCVNFNQSNSNIQTPTTNIVAPGTNPNFTLAAWINLSSLNTNGYRIAECNTGAGTGGFLFAVNSNGTVQANVKYSTTDAQIIATPASALVGRWSRVVMVWDSSQNTPSIYINGVLTNTTPTNKVGTINAPFTSAKIYVGNRAALDRPLQGLMDEFGIWPTIWTAQNVKDDYFRNTQPNSPALLYHMEETSGNLTDSSANALTGTPTNITQNVASFNSGTRSLA